MTRQFILPLAEELIVDLFAGGGGMSVAIEQALGRHADIAVNHNDDALSMHRANHPQTRHFIADVFEVDPRGATQGRPVGHLHLSPDCTHFSQAKGGQPRSAKIRGLSWVAIRWAGQARPRCISLENVKQLVKWGPLVAKRDAATGRVIRLDGTVAEPAERVPVAEQFLIPDPKRAGKTWARFLTMLRGLGYTVEHRLMVAADYGAPTTRERLFLFARCDGEPIVWPKPTHHKIPERGQKRWRAAAECIDWTIPCPSIFERKRPLADATLRRIARGIKRYVIDAKEPFIVPATHQGSDRGRSTDEPLPTITAAHRGEQMLVSPILAGVGGRAGDSEPRSADQPQYTITAKADTAILTPTLLKIRGNSDGGRLDLPLPTITSGAGAKRDAGAAHAMGVIVPHLQQITQGGREHDAGDPLKTITTAKGGEQAVVAASLVQAGHGEGEGATKRRSHGINDIAQPLGTVTASNGGHYVAAASLIQTGYGEREGQAPRSLDIDQPLGTVVGGAAKHAAVAAFLAQQNTMPNGGVHADHHARDPLSTVTNSGSQQNIVAASLATLRGTNTGRAADEPLRTASAGGEHHALVQYTLSPEQEAGALRCAALLIRYYGEGGQWGDLSAPAATLTTKDRLGLVTVWLHGHPYVIVDIGLRMLTPRELYRAQGFPDGYIIERGHDGRTFSKSAQVRMVGNSVSPQPAAALLGENHAPRIEQTRAAA